MLSEAVSAGASVESVYLDGAIGDAERELALRCAASGARVFDLDSGVLARVAATVNPQPIIAVVAAADVPLASLAPSSGADGLVVVCAGVRDPGNAGTVVRAAAAAGARAVVACGSSVDLGNPKALRASAGAAFRVPVVNGAGVDETIDSLRSWGLTAWATAAAGGVDYVDADLAAPCAVVLGNESHGVDPELARSLDGTLSIPMPGRAESLNVGTAAAVLCFESARQRRKAGDGRPLAPGEPPHQKEPLVQ